MLLLGAVGAVATFRRPTLLRVFLIWDFVLSLAVYSWANERFTWLVLHPLLPLILLAGFGVQSIWEARSRWTGKVGLALVVVCVAYTGYTTYRANVENGADPREFLVTTQSAPAVRGVRDEVRAVAERAEREGRTTRIVVDAAEGATFPWAWYFRDLPAEYLDMTGQDVPSDADVLILTDANRARLLPQLAGYDGRRFPFRVWWIRDYGKLSPGSALEWMAERKTWSPTGGMPEWLYLRQGA
jgi:predicted membrane-bound mannosyltransferase